MKLKKSTMYYVPSEIKKGKKFVMPCNKNNFKNIINAFLYLSLICINIHYLSFAFS